MNRFWAALARIWVLHETRKELHTLSDHMLRDIGLRRDQLQSLEITTNAPVSRGVARYAVTALSVAVPAQYSRKLRD